MSTATTVSVGRHLMDLPPDVIATILHKLGAIEIIESAQKVCLSWRRICKDASMWRHVDMRNSGDVHGVMYDLEKMCVHAIDRSNGGLIDINIEYFGTDELLHYIADRSNSLKCLRLVSCYDISDEGLIEMAPKLSALEELDISLCSFSKDALEAVGRCCPLLKSLKLNCQPFFCSDMDECDEGALAIAETMPGLLHLQLVGNFLTDIGLQAILNGCSKLESLDLRRCLNLDLRGDLEKVCVRKIKALKLPNDPMDGYPFSTEAIGDGSFDGDDYPYGFSDIELLSNDDEDYYEFSSMDGDDVDFLDNYSDDDFYL